MCSVRHSEWHRSQPVGGPPGQGEYVNAAAVIETTIAPLTIARRVAAASKRGTAAQRGERWAPRTLDIDILLYGNEVSETPMLTLPHPRMTFRTFVLEPAAEVAPKMLHPVIGWPVERLLLHLQQASDSVAMVSPSESIRQRIAGSAGRAMWREADRVGRHSPTADHHWPPLWTTWLEVSAGC